MGISTIDAGKLKNAFLAGAKGLEAKKDWINELNVFPVPDGDTGTNMTLTIMAAAREVAELENPTMDQLAKAISSGSLRGARGNSGVILSQLLRGFTKEIKSVTEIDTTTLANAMVRGTETAYKAVMKPKEGTILTVAKGMSDKALEMASKTDDIEEFAREVIAYGDYVLDQTPEMLPVLKQAGVVDSGGQGLMQVVKGAFDGLTGRMADVSLDAVPEQKGPAAQKPQTASLTDIDTADIKFGYCTEFIINLEKDYSDQDENQLKSYLESIGDSLVVVSDDEIVKVHVHTNHPGLAFEKALTYGSLSRMKVDNMREEHQERIIKDSERLAREQAAGNDGDVGQPSNERKTYGFIAVSSGDGLSEIFKGIGADYLIEGGQTMNPSTEDMLNAIDKVNADNIFILPNNKNIIMAAQQARDLTEDKNIIVIPSKTVPQGITALVNFMPDLSAEDNLAAMTEEMDNVKTAQITYAVRTTNIDGMEIEEGDIMAIGDHGMLAAGKSVERVAMDALKCMLDDDCELVTVYYGSDVVENAAKALVSQAEQMYPDKEIELQYGGQPIYYYMISAE
ncbi:DAK2 domain-containing protein [Lachnoclostridium pacaense]|uniref:DAK2 domain-containing protein n=1 Tax=Enterocloster hominis (ex Hitch et al. 2024) TaxID=1917870 RepID=UPI001D11FB10|nr:DAK2 domain-containing protein [Lachnoclostridium pacaense]MCC2817910.1 DAK2 domain-containing protein [Lachnoclostridium pacaense]MCC2875705.1 DAK2 domain-containing protein [Lachnoclostridium pacaense]